MRRSTILGTATAAALAAGSLAVGLAPGSSHREAPKILADPTADNTDVYAFTAPDAPGSPTVVANWIPLEEPAGGPYFGKLDPEARYYVKVDNTGDGRPDVAYRWEFDQRFRNPESFLDAAPTVDSIGDPDLNFVQTYDLYRETYHGKKVRARRIAQRRAGRPANAGPKTYPDYGKVAAAGHQRRRGRREDVRRPGRRPVLRRPRRGLRRDQHRQARPAEHRPRQPGRRQGRRRGLQHPRVRPAGARAQVTRDGKAVAGAGRANAVVGVWATTERRRLTVRRRPQGEAQLGPGQPPRQPADQRGGHPARPEGPLQPHEPADDAANYGKYAMNPEPARLLNALFGLGAEETNRTDIVRRC